MATAKEIATKIFMDGFDEKEILSELGELRGLDKKKKDAMLELRNKVVEAVLKAESNGLTWDDARHILRSVI